MHRSVSLHPAGARSGFDGIARPSSLRIGNNALRTTAPAPAAVVGSGTATASLTVKGPSDSRYYNRRKEEEEEEDESEESSLNERRHSISSQYDTKIGFKTELDKRIRSKSSSDRHGMTHNSMTHPNLSISQAHPNPKREKTVSFKRPMLSE